MKANKAFELSLSPLGGVAEIGSNCTIIETKNNIVIIDYGILFPYEDFFNINYLIAPLDKSKFENKEMTIFMTHGHEDHIGAINHLVDLFPGVPIHAPAFAANLMRKKLHQTGRSAKIVVIEDTFKLTIDDIILEPVHVTHSIPHTFGVILSHTKNLFSLLFISDFKYDLNPIFEKPFDIDKIKDRFSKAKNTYTFIDSTNILSPGKTVSESELEKDLRELIKQERRIFITLFSSNIWRVKLILEIAKSLNKRVVAVGRSLNSYFDTASETGLIGDEGSVFNREDQIQDFATTKNIYLLTGCQGDHFGALRRVTSKDHKHLAPKEKDLFIFSSKAIPGNEKKITRIYNNISEAGAEIITSRDKLVHASGHPSQVDLLTLYKELTPNFIIPIHGESYFLEKHVDFVNEHKLGEPLMLTNNDIFYIDTNGKPSIESHPKEQPILIHSKELVIEREAISERRKIANMGVVFVTVNLERRNVFVSHKGLPRFILEQDEKILNLIKGQLSKRLLRQDSKEISEEIRIFTRNIYNTYLHYKPITQVHIV